MELNAQKSRRTGVLADLPPNATANLLEPAEIGRVGLDKVGHRRSQRAESEDIDRNAALANPEAGVAVPAGSRRSLSREFPSVLMSNRFGAIDAPALGGA